MISAVFFDIDGVLTDGKIYVDSNGNQTKAYKLTEIDAINEIKKMGIQIYAITGEDETIVSIFKDIVDWDYFFKGCKNKGEIVKEVCVEQGLSKKEICYIGDGKYDIQAIKYVGLGVCPSNAIQEVKSVSRVVLKGSGGNTCISDLLGLLKKYNSNNCDNFSAVLNEALANHRNLFGRLFKNVGEQSSINTAANLVLDSIIDNGTLYLCGNGGSAADAQHIATEFVSRFYKERIAINAEALTTNTSSLTAIANDYEFDRIFERQLEAKGKPGDVLIGITTSGTSRNVIRAMEYAAKHGIHTILLTGNRPNEYDPSIYECVIKVPSDDTPRIQEAHIFIGHVIAEYVEARMVETESIENKSE